MIDKIADRITSWVGSTPSLLVHTVFFSLTFATHWLFGWQYELILLMLTTVVSLEAIYISIFIQRAVNQQGARLQEVEQTLDDVEEAVDEVGEALDEVEESLDEVEQSLDDVEQDLKEAEEDSDEQDASLETLLKEVRQLRKELKEAAKASKQ